MASRTPRAGTAAPSDRSTRSRGSEGDALGGFHPAVGAWFRAALGEPTEVQTRGWKHIQNGETTLLFAPTGSGKTLAAFLAAIDRLATSPVPGTPAMPKRAPAKKAAKNRLRVLYVSPLKALAVDIEKNLRAPVAGIAEAAVRLGATLRRLDVAVRTGDTPTQDRAKMLRAPPDILITTPESLYLLLTSSQREMLASVDTVIIDEIHQMAATKRGAHLFLSLERLEALRGERVQRIGLSATQKPLDEIARLLGGYEEKRPTAGGTKPPKSAKSAKNAKSKLVPRPVAIVDASRKRALSITVEVPPPLAPAALGPLDDEDGGDDDKSVWPQVHARLVERIRAATSTMIFVNSRRLAERLAAALNETADEEIALAHHGSVAKEKRRVIEERLKAGQLPAIVATSSLELGIDMGSVDQVIQVEAPPSVASGIQRIGRASHHVGGVPSGVLIPKHKHDLLACAAAAAGIEAGDVEETRVPKNPLDVLAQQIVAMAAMSTHDGDLDVEDVWNLVRRAAPFAALPRGSFDGVLDMLAGRYPSDEFADLRPRITWDRARGTIAGRHGAQRLAILNGGTIPDRGLYGVFLADGSSESESDTSASKKNTSRRVGELDEEMVFELREGEVFLLGASSWRAEQITRDRVLVTPAAGQPGKMPFWHGDRAGRTLAFGSRIGALARTVADKPVRDSLALLRETFHLDPIAAEGLTTYLHEQKKATGTVPSDRTIVVERIPDELGDLRICVLTPFGSRIHAPWSMAVLRKLREARAGDIEAVWSDDGMVFRVPGGEAPPPTDLFFPSADEIEDLVTRELGGSSLFAARFREAAARALLLPRQAVGRRTPLWAQRKRAADLLSVASQFPTFPIVLETYRECLRDAFDLPGLGEILRGVAARTIKVHTVDATTPSPFAGSLLFAFAGNFIYDEDAPAAERRAQALTIDHAQLRELLGEAEIRKLLDPDVVLEHERMLQRRDRRLRHADAVHDLLLWLGDLTDDEITARAEDANDATEWIDRLLRERRAVRVRIAGETRIIAVEDAARYRDAIGVVLERGLPSAFVGPTKDALLGLVARFARTHGPFTADAVAARWGLGVASIVTCLERLGESGKVLAGGFLPIPDARRGTAPPTEWCDAEVLRAIKQKTLARLRKAIEPVSSAAFARFLGEWQGVSRGALRTLPPTDDDHDRDHDHDRDDDESPDDEALEDELARERGNVPTLDEILTVVGQLEGCPIPASVLESEVLPARVPGYRPYMLDQLVASGEVVWAGVEPIGGSDGRVALYRAEHEPLLARPAIVDARPTSALHDAIREHLEKRGAIFFAEIARSVGGFPRDTLEALWDLVWSGEVTNDTLEPLRALVRGTPRERGRSAREARLARRVRASRVGPPGSEGRWSLRRARWEREASPTERSTAAARALLERYGVVLREAAAAEALPGGFSYVYDVYRAMEEQGRIRRGYFVAQRGAMQFALPGAEERLRIGPTDDAKKGDVLVLAATDPANPYGSLVPWPKVAGRANAEGRNAQRAPGARVIVEDGRIIAWIARGGQHLVTFFAAGEPDGAHDATVLARTLVDLGRSEARTVVITTIDGIAAPESVLASVLTEHGFASRQGTLTLLRGGRLGRRPFPVLHA